MYLKDKTWILTRRELLATSAGNGICLGLGLNPAANAQTGQIILKPIPSTGELLPVIGLGTNRWVADGDKNTTTALKSTLTTFSNLGGRVIDTAPAYRSSESALGELIADIGIRNAFFLATKVDKEDSVDGVMRMENSRLNLQTEQLDLMQVHNLRGAETQLRSMLIWKATERVRYIGITTSRTNQFAKMERLMKRYPLDFIQLNYSVVEREAEKRLLPLAQERKIGVMVNLPFHRGRLFAAVKDKPLPKWSSEFDCSSWAQFFLKYVVSHPAVTCTIPGMTKAKHAEDNMGACYGKLPDEAQRKRMAAIFKAT
ncbi:MAG: aldo/keto reductase [Gammaproteobacteria bacterium]|nr:aldo/keto reductase [Gammaproteobacteria bacterium]MCP4276439.1 aldo/keto reductase [Gammaproteobacteria bacterium]MCP4831086.1 aldo/keto reductase [Gammaproteobacteria bacterium]MCP4929354.1 aldo/keto reductase [Gammaproteobacteria bacterium]